MSSLLSALHRPSTGSAPTPHNAIPSATYCQRPALCRAAARNLPSYNYDVRIDHNRQFPRKSTTFATPAEHKSWCTWESARLSHKSCPGDKRVEKRGRGEGGGTAKAVGVGIWRVAAASEVGEGEQGGGGDWAFPVLQEPGDTVCCINPHALPLRFLRMHSAICADSGV